MTGIDAAVRGFLEREGIPAAHVSVIDGDGTTLHRGYGSIEAAAPRRFAPGTRWAYSNTNYKALALIVERVTKRPFDDVVAATVLRPAGLEGIAPCHDLPADRITPGISSDGKPTPLDASRAAYAGDGGLRLVILTNRGFVWLTELMPWLIGELPHPVATGRIPRRLRNRLGRGPCLCVTGP